LHPAARGAKDIRQELNESIASGWNGIQTKDRRCLPSKSQRLLSSTPVFE